MTHRLLEIDTVRIEFADNHVAVRDISLSINRGEIVGIAGPSGSGKSLTMWSLLGLTPDRSSISGSLVYYNEQGEPHNISIPEAARKLAGRTIGMIPQNPFTSLNPAYTCGVQISEMLRQHALSQEERIRKVHESLQELGFSDPERIYHAYPFELSGGQLQRVVIAMATIANPELLIADEPTTALDVITQTEVLNLLHAWVGRNSKSMFLVSHDLSLLSAYCQRVYLIEKGSIVLSGTPQEALSRYPKGYPENSSSLLAADNDPLCSMRDVSIRYDARSGARIDAVQSLSLDIRAGEVIGLVGATGCGKSTVAKALTGLVFPHQGALTFHQKPLNFSKNPELRKSIQMIFQDPYSALYPHFTVGSYLKEAIRHHRITSRSQETVLMHQALEEVGLAETFAGRFPHELSGGERQRVQIARAMLIRPELLICDEITSGLDEAIQGQILNLLIRLKKVTQMSLLLISHDLHIVRHMADRVVIMDKGRVVEEGSVQQIFSRPLHQVTRILTGHHLNHSALPDKE